MLVFKDFSVETGCNADDAVRRLDHTFVNFYESGNNINRISWGDLFAPIHGPVLIEYFAIIPAHERLYIFFRNLFSFSGFLKNFSKNVSSHFAA